MSEKQKHSVSFFILNPDYLDDLEDVLDEAFPEIVFTRTENMQSADIVFADTVTPLDAAARTNKRFVVYDEIEDVIPALNSRLASGDVYMPTALSRERMLADIHEFDQQFDKVRDSTQRSLDADSLGEITATVPASVVSLHPTQMSRYIPKIKRVLDRRVERGYQRYINAYTTVAPMVSTEGYPAEAAFQADTSVSADVRVGQMRAAVQTRAEELELHGLSAPVTSMEYSQINVGMPFFGGLERQEKGLSAPTPRYRDFSRFVAEEMLMAAAVAHASSPIDGENVRVGVKSYAFQGAPLCSYSHTARQTAWSIMQNSKDGIFHFEKMHFPSVIGLRRQDNPSKKKRPAFLAAPDGFVARGRVYDGDELSGRELPSFVSFPKFAMIPRTDPGVWGARVRHVDNVSSLQNDALVPVPAYIAKWKDRHYKKVFQQDAEIFESLIPGTVAFSSFWREGWDTQPWVAEYAAKRGCSNFESLLSKMTELGEFLFCGDVGNFDGNMTWDLMEPGLRHLLSDRVFELANRMEKSSLIGAYTGADGELVYYVVDKQDQELGERTAKLSSHLNSGLGITSQVGRITVPAMLLEIAETAFSIPKHIIESKPALVDDVSGKTRSSFSFMSAFLNSAGDDHSTMMLVAWLVTGKHPKECQEHFRKTAEAYKIMEIAEEQPPMNAGWLFHTGEDGRLTNFSLSPKRLLTRNLAPERGRSAVGLSDSTGLYVASAIGTPAEEAMLVARDVVVSTAMGFESLDDLEDLRAFEMDAIMNDPDMATPAEKLAAFLGVPVNTIEWAYTYEELVELGVPEDILDEFKRPIPSDLTAGPFNFLNKQTIEAIASTLSI